MNLIKVHEITSGNYRILIELHIFCLLKYNLQCYAVSTQSRSPVGMD